MRIFSAKTPNDRRAVARVAAAIFIPLLVSGCSTAVHGTSQKTRLTVNPPGTRLEIYRWNGEKLVEGTSPQEIEIPRPKANQSYLLKASRAGYCPRFLLTDNEMTAMGMTTAITGIATLGLAYVVINAVDHTTGASYEVKELNFGGTLEGVETCEP